MASSLVQGLLEQPAQPAATAIGVLLSGHPAPDALGKAEAGYLWSGHLTNQPERARYGRATGSREDHSWPPINPMRRSRSQERAETPVSRAISVSVLPPGRTLAFLVHLRAL